MAFNEEIMLPYTIQFYRQRFPDCRIIIMDNESSDCTCTIARDKGCEIKSFNSYNQISDLQYQFVKNTYWKDATSPWVLIADADECLDITQAQLLSEQDNGSTIIQSQAYNMVNMNNDFNIAAITQGYRDKTVETYDKSLLFNKTYIRNINYGMGAHTCIPDGHVVYSTNKYRLFHYKYLNPDYMVARYALFKSRLSEANLKNSWGGQFLNSEAAIRDEFAYARQRAQSIIK